MISKTKLLEHIAKFPNEIAIDDLIDKLVFIDKLEKRIQQSNEQDTMTEQAMEEEMKTWFK
jgi:flagellar biosynthesis chaperone FliJ